MPDCSHLCRWFMDTIQLGAHSTLWCNLLKTLMQVQHFILWSYSSSMIIVHHNHASYGLWPTGRRSQVFLAFDYGTKENLNRYGTTYPEAYDLSQVTAPVYIFYGGKDIIASPQVNYPDNWTFHHSEYFNDSLFIWMPSEYIQFLFNYSLGFDPLIFSDFF